MLKNFEQLSNSILKGLSSGGTHFNAVVIYAFFNLSPSLTWSELLWFEIFALWRHLYKKSEDLSPVNTLPVLVPPWAAGAKPINNIFAFVSPKPVIGLPQ